MKWAKKHNFWWPLLWNVKKNKIKRTNTKIKKVYGHANKSLLPKTTNFIKNTYTLSMFGMCFVVKFNMMRENTPIKLTYSPYSHQIWTSSEKFICTYSFFKVQNKETNKQPLIVKYHLALLPLSLSEALCATVHVKMVQILATPLPHSAVVVNIFEGSWSILKVGRLYLEGYFILAGSPRTLFFFFPAGSPNQGPG